MSSKPGMLPTAGAAALALVIFIPLFATGGIGAFDFWLWMSCNAALLTLLCAVSDREWRRDLREDVGRGPVFRIGLGVASAVLLYGVFALGNKLAPLVIPGAANNVGAVYDLKAGASPLRVGLLIGLLIGPAEEFFWRAFLQRRLADHLGPWRGFLISAMLYTGMHISSLNPMLVIAAGVCGVFWGLLYMRFKSVWLNVVSHVVWDLSIFMFFPLS